MISAPRGGGGERGSCPLLWVPIPVELWLPIVSTGAVFVNTA